MAGAIKLLVTRPEPDAGRTALALEALGIVPILAPLLVATPWDTPLPNPDAYSAIALTSPNGARFFLACNPDVAMREKPVFAVGAATAEIVRNAGFVQIRAAEETLTSLANLIAKTHNGGTILHAGGRDLSGDLGAALAPHAIPVLAITLYAMEQAKALPPALHEAILNGEIAGGLFFSRRTAEAFVRLFTKDDAEPLKHDFACLCISDNCAAPLKENNFLDVRVALHPDHESMMALAHAFARNQIRA